MGKLTVFTTITPLPSNVPRQLALDMLHAHTEVIELNPLVTGVKSIEAPRDASSDEYFSQWYEITEIITWGLGLKKKLSFKGVFHDQPWGLQTHVYLPLGVDLRNKYRIGGNQPGEPREARELGVDTPLDGLYLRNDVEIICNVTMASFIKKETKAAIGIMIDRMTRKAELLDEGKLHAMFENGRLKTTKPTTNLEDNAATVVASPPVSPAPFRTSPAMPSAAAAVSPSLDHRGFGNYRDVARHGSQYQANPGTSRYSPAQNYQYPAHTNELSAAPVVNELPGSYSYQPATQQSFTAELQGDNTYSSVPPQAQQRSLDVKPPNQYQAYAPPPAPQQQLPHPAVRNSAANPPSANPAYYENHAVTTNPQQQAPGPRESRTSVSSAQSQPPTYREQQTNVPNSQLGNRSGNAGSQQASPPLGPTHRESQASISSFANAARKHSAASSVYSNPTPTTATSVSSIGGGGNSSGIVRPGSNAANPSQEPDHSRFASLSIGTGNGSGGNPVPAPLKSSATPPPAHSRSPPPPSLARQNKSPKCPVCGLFEGDEAAISHHVGQAHFS